MKRMMTFHFSPLKLTLVSLLFVSGAIFFVFFSLLLLPRHPFVAGMGALATLLSSFPLAICVYRLAHISHPAIALNGEQLIFASGFHDEAIMLSTIESVELRAPASESLGHRLYIRFHPETKGGWRGAIGKEISLALVAVNNSELLRLVKNEVERVKAQSSTNSRFDTDATRRST